MPQACFATWPGRRFFGSANLARDARRKARRSRSLPSDVVAASKGDTPPIRNRLVQCRLALETGNRKSSRAPLKIRRENSNVRVSAKVRGYFFIAQSALRYKGNGEEGKKKVFQKSLLEMQPASLRKQVLSQHSTTFALPSEPYLSFLPFVIFLIPESLNFDAKLANPSSSLPSRTKLFFCYEIDLLIIRNFFHSRGNPFGGYREIIIQVVTANADF